MSAFTLDKFNEETIRTLPVEQLTALCSSENLTNYSGLNKDELVNLLLAEKKRRKEGDHDDNPKPTKIVSVISK
jgi:hypothetical protein